jgi:ribosomal protein L37E
MENTQVVQWRCRNCGTSSPIQKSSCHSCGGDRPNKNKDRSRLISSSLSNENNNNVQNNINNIAIHGGVRLDENYFMQADNENGTAIDTVEPQVQRSTLSAFFMVTCGIAIWVSILVMFLFVTFFSVIIFKAYFS